MIYICNTCIKVYDRDPIDGAFIFYYFINGLYRLALLCYYFVYNLSDEYSLI